MGPVSGRPSSPTPPGGPKTAIRRRAAADQKEKVANARPASTRAAGAGGSSSTMLSRSISFAVRRRARMMNLWFEHGSCPVASIAADDEERISC